MIGTASFWGTLAILAGVLLLHLAWQRRDGALWPLLIGACIAVTAGLAFWALAGADAGVATGVLILMTAALAVVARAGWRHARSNGRRAGERLRRAPSRSAVSQAPGAAGYLHDAFSLLIAVPLTGVVAVMGGLALIAAAASSGAAPSNGIAAAFLLVPVLWAGLASWILVQSDLKRRSIAFTGAALLFGLAFLLTAQA